VRYSYTYATAQSVGASRVSRGSHRIYNSSVRNNEYSLLGYIHPPAQLASQPSDTISKRRISARRSGGFGVGGGGVSTVRYTKHRERMIDYGLTSIAEITRDECGATTHDDDEDDDHLDADCISPRRYGLTGNGNLYGIFMQPSQLRMSWNGGSLLLTSPAPRWRSSVIRTEPARGRPSAQRDAFRTLRV